MTARRDTTRELLVRRVTEWDRSEFRSYLWTCTDAQVRGVHELERVAGRRVYIELAREEAKRRGISL
jgi:hypothetical protein